MNDLLFALIIICSVADGARDGFRADAYNGISNKGRHIIKWIAFYPPMIVMALQLDFWFMVVSPFAALIAWQLGLLFTPVRWRSMWVRWSVILWNKFKAWREKK